MEPGREVARVIGYQIDDLAGGRAGVGGLGLLGVAASRLEGSTWDGSVLVYEVQGGDDGMGGEAGVLKLRSAHRTPHGTASVTFAGGGEGSDLWLIYSCPYGLVALGLNSIRIWNLGHPSVSTRELTAHTDHVNALAWSPHADSLLGSISKDRTLQLWDLRANNSQGGAGQLVHGVAHAGTAIAWAPNKQDLVAVGLDDGSVTLLDIRNPTHPLLETSQKHRHGAPVFSLCFAVEGTGTALLVSGGDDGALMVSGEGPPLTPRCKIPCHGDYIRGVVTWTQGKETSILSGSWDSTIVRHKL